MDTKSLTIIDITQEATTNEAYKNIPVAQVNDHVVRMGVMTEPYFWHLHPESDESFLVIEGSYVYRPGRPDGGAIPQPVIYHTQKCDPSHKAKWNQICEFDF